jgi:hypothetical protein
MVGQGTGPGVPHTADPDQPPDIGRVGGQRVERLCRGAASAVVQIVLVAADAHPQRLGSGADDLHVGDRPQFLPPRRSPGFGVEAMTRGATAVAAGGVHVLCLTTMIAWPQLPTEGLRPAPEHSSHGAALAGPAVLPKALQGLTPLASADVCHLWPGRAPARSELGHEGSDRGGHDVQGGGRQMRVAGGGPRTPRAQPCRNDPPRHPPLHQRGRIGGPQGMAGGIFGEPTLAHHRGERLVEGGGR